MTQNVTIALPDELVKAARHLAVDEGLSLSGYVARVLAEKVGAQREYTAARERQLRLMEQGLDLGLDSGVTWTRDSLHER